MADDTEPSRSSFDEWPEKAVDLVDLVVDTIRDRIVRPVILVGRAIVFGLLIAAAVVVVAVVVSIAGLRFLDVYAFPNHVWASYALLGTVFTIAGLWAWSKRTTSGGSGTDA
jgi:H+/Cl- antiporter ClcA